MAEAFWAFSLAVYERAGVSAACIALQDAYGADVDVLLYALWCASRGHCLDEAALRAVDAEIAAWRETVVRPIREVRRALKPPPPPFDTAAVAAVRRELLQAELHAERLQQAAMEALGAPSGTADPTEAAQHNLALLAHVACIAEDAAPLGALLQTWRG